MHTKTTLLILSLLLSLFSYGQMQTTQATFNGETYNIYPVRLPFNNTSSQSDEYGELIDYEMEFDYVYSGYYHVNAKRGKWKVQAVEQFLPYNPFNLKDGKYLAYYEKVAYKWDEFGLPIYTHEDTSKVAVTFEIVNNKKHGKVVWYDFGKKRNVIQTCSYDKGIKTGEWRMTRKDHLLVCHYLNGKLNGEWLETSKGRVITRKNFVLGVINGESVSYFFNKPKQVRHHSVSRMGQLIESKTYDHKGRLTTWYSTAFENGLYQKNYNKGVLIRESYYPDSLGLEKSVTYYENGQKDKEYIQYNLVENHLLNIESKPTPWYVKFFSLYTNEISSPDDCLSYTDYYDNGQIRVSYDIRKDSLKMPITVYNREGLRIAEYSFNPNSIRTKKVSFHPENQRIESEVLYSGSVFAASKYYNTEGELTRFYLSSNYLGSLYPDSTGFVLSAHYKTKEKDTKYYTLLHTDQRLKEVIYKGERLSKITTRSYEQNGLPMAELIYSEFDKDHEFEVRYTHHFYTPKISQTDDYTEQILNQYYNSIQLKNRSLKEVPDSLNLQIFYHGKPFSGKLMVTKARKSRKNKIRPAYRIKLDKKATKHEEETILLVDDYFERNDFEYHGRVGVFDGQIYNISLPYGGGDFNYSNNKRNGERSSYCYTGYHKNGLAHGLHKGSSTSSEYYKGKLHGPFLEYGYYSPDAHFEGQIDYRANFYLDTLNGLWQSYVRPMEVSQQVVFEKGQPHGEYWRGNIDAPTSARVQLNHGYIIDTSYYYFTEGTLKATVYNSQEDSIYFDNYYQYRFKESGNKSDYLAKLNTYTDKEIHLLSHTNQSNPALDLIDNDKLIDFNGNRTGDYTYYYKNGVKASTGRVENGSKVGTWQYWDLSGELYKRVKHDSGWFVNPISNDSIFYYGKVEMWYPNGKPLLTGLILSQFERFKCDQEMKVDFENLYYLSFYDEEGNSSLKPSGSDVHEYHNNSEKRLEGEMVDGKRSGIWRFYDPNGRLEEIGKYIEGHKEGLWIAGDLEAVPFYEDLCMKGDVEAYKFPDPSKSGVVTQPIRITEKWYVKGFMRSSDRITLYPLY